ncbi:TolC family protein [Sphingosinicella sp. LHD-64]|uniref:TolC family protein n=1 Tax=Sphingosinicella sp. LHD-64 TaxID=3072139 RepID=UPI00280DAF9E|nr:TolC family protein [Sphingosinicella sp. LHD-64]MDQ8757383.1 TolC family protein [Sphingosinicella sp. LHD-64]
MSLIGPSIERRARLARVATGRWACRLAAIALLAVAAVPAAAQAVPGEGGAVLTMNDAVALARGDQLAVAAFAREAAASEDAAVAAGTLPDPQIIGGVQNYPVTGDVAFHPTRDDMTMYTIGVMREQVRRARREAAAAQLQAQAVVSRAEGTAQERRIQREVMIAWINAVEAAARQRLLARVINDLDAGRRIMEAGIPTGASTPALALQAQAEVALAQSQLAEARGQEARARAELARWIGPAAHQALPNDVPDLTLPAMPAEVPSLETHPNVRLAEAQAQAARRQVDAARTERRPNLSWSVIYGWRPDYGDMVSAQVTIPLQINRGRLQNRRIAEAEARADAARLRAEDARRELDGAYGAALADYRAADAQLTLLRAQAIPALEASFETAEARYAGGQGSLELPLAIVRRYVEANIQAVEQQGRRARAAAELIYLTGEAGQ